jgi:hypothetical protein
MNRAGENQGNRQRHPRAQGRYRLPWSTIGRASALVSAVIVQAAVTTSVLRDKAEVTGSLHHE